VASIQIYFKGEKFVPLQGGDEVKAPKPKAEGPRVRVEFLGRGQRSHSPPAKGSGGVLSVVSSPSRVWGGAPENLKFCAT